MAVKSPHTESTRETAMRSAVKLLNTPTTEHIAPKLPTANTEIIPKQAIITPFHDPIVADTRLKSNTIYFFVSRACCRIRSIVGKSKTYTVFVEKSRKNTAFPGSNDIFML